MPSRAVTGRAAVVHPALADADGRSSDGRRAQARLEEAVALAQAISLKICHADTVRLDRPRAGTFFGRGVIERLEAVIAAQEIDLVVIDGTLSPVQQRNLERAWHCKVIDRTGLILEIFGARARTKEGKLQVELAALSYQRSRLVRSWTHLERQRGGAGFLGGPGESQIELDRRIISERIDRLKADLLQVKRTRELHRKARRRVPYPIVALVGYTNAGKSTLFNRLTEAGVVAKDLLFATLDPTMRRLTLPGGQDIILSDTVGFISDLPTDLVAAFRATLEEVVEADVILHVRDASHPDGETQCQAVLEILQTLQPKADQCESVIEVFNKIDRLSPEERSVLEITGRRNGGPLLCSAITGEGCEALLEKIASHLRRSHDLVHLSVPHREGGAVAWLYDHGHVVSRHDDEGAAHLDVLIDQENLARFHRRYGTACSRTSSP